MLTQTSNVQAVVGAGYIGVELAEAFERLGKEVTVVDIVDTCLAGYYDPEFSDLMKKNLEITVLNQHSDKKQKLLKVTEKLKD